MPRTKRLHALKRPKLRQDWSKWTLYNLSRITTPPAANKTFFQQKWLAKSMLRAYHNPDVREGTWTRMFDRRLPAVVPMDHRYLAKYDGSEMASGRGSGADKAPERPVRGRGAGMARPVEKTPYMHMTFHPLERRLDTAIFRALFASSTRQARQMVVHGFVKVNGKRMIYPGYQLNPGDMFTVDPERVMFSTGAQKLKKDSTKSVQDARRDKEEREQREEAPALGSKDSSKDDEFVEYETTAEEGQSKEDDDKIKAKTALKKLLQRAKSILDESKQKLAGKRQQELRGFTQEVNKTFSRLRGTSESEVDTTIENFETALAEILTKVPAANVPKPSSTTSDGDSSASSASSSSSTTTTLKPQQADHRARKDAELLHAALERARANPVDVSKPYATPWKPREFMSAFAFIPRYLEVNQNICSAVYLRHPVARPGLAEVPTPFSAETMGLGFNWYLRRR